MHFQSSHGLQPTAEFLEGRTLLAGNVTTAPTGDPDSPGQPAPTLLIIGDEVDNEIMVRRGNAPDEIIVNGLNGTLVNGSTREWHYSGVEQIVTQLLDGNDTFDGRNLALSAVTPAPPGDPAEGSVLGRLAVDGGSGDDRLTLFNTTINATAPEPVTPPDPENPPPPPIGSASVELFGESSVDVLTGEVVPVSGTGNDFIEVSDTTIVAEGGASAAGALQIFGEQNAGGAITGGNDHINVSNTVIRAEDTSLSAGAAVFILGELNIADAANPSTIGQGNDTISLTNTTVSVGGSSLLGSSSAVVDIRGDQNSSAGGLAEIGVGNDSISVTNFAASTSGVGLANMTDLSIFGDGDVDTLDATSRIDFGNDVISLSNDDVFASGGPLNSATVLVYSDDRTPEGEAGTTVGQGTDDVRISNFRVQASTSSNVQLHTQKGHDVVDIHNIEVGGFGMSTGTGNDDVTILNSEWMTGNFDLEDGNDLLRMNGNMFVVTDADGGLGLDVLFARNNVGTIVATNFEEINGMPSLPLMTIVG